MKQTYRYTDRDVREIPDAFDIVVNYLEQYKGEFQFLVDCKMRVEVGSSLTVGMIRGVLNCMRVDPRVHPDILPEPTEWPEDVIPLPERTHYEREPRSFQKNKVIEIKPRELRNDGKYAYRLPATVHSEYIFVKGKSPSTLTVHLITEAEVEWHPFRYADDPGWSRPPELIIHTNCKYPYYLRNPKLLTIQMVDEYETLPLLRRCSYCFYKEEG